MRTKFVETLGSLPRLRCGGVNGTAARVLAKCAESMAADAMLIQP